MQSRTLLFNANAAWFFISHRLPIARAARERGYAVHLVTDCQSEDEAQVLKREGVAVHSVPVRRSGLNPIYDMSYMTQLGRVIRRVRPALMHNISVKPIVYGSVAARALSVPHIVNAVSGLGYSFTGGGSRRFLASLVSAAYKLALRDRRIRVIFQNRDDIQAFVRAGIIAPEQSVLIRGSGADLDSFRSSPEPAGTLRVVLPARMLRDKGVVEFAHAAKLLRARGCNAEFLLAGKIDTGNPAALTSHELAALQADTGVQWLGHVADMPSLYRSVNVVCLPSYREGLPKALIEACAAGRAVISTDVPGCREVVTPGENGFLVAPRDARSLADALQKLLEDARLRVRMGLASRRKAEAEFDVRAVAKATLDLYQEMLN